MLKIIKDYLFKNKSEKQTVIKNSFWLAFGNITSRLIRATLIIYAARILGTEGYGVFSYALSLAAFFTIFSDIGLSGLLTRESIKKPEKIAEYFSTTFLIKLGLVVLTILITIFIAPNFIRLEAAKTLIPLVALLLAFDSLSNFGFALIRAQSRMELEAILLILTNLAVAALGFLSLIMRPTAFSLTIAYIAGSAIGFMLVVIILRHHFKDIFKHFQKSLIKPILTSAWPFAIMGLLGGFMINIDTLIIGWFRSAHELGLYAAAQRPVMLLYAIPALLSISLFPLTNELIKNKNYERIKKILEKSLTSVIGLAIPITLGGIILGKPLISLIFGVKYVDATLTFQLLLITTLLVFPGTIIGNTIFAYDRQKIFITSTLFGALSNIALDLILIPIYGIAGSAVATIISLLFANGYNWHKMKQINDFKILPFLSKILIASLIMGFVTLILFFLHINVILNIIFSITVYGAMLFLLKEPFLEIIGLKSKQLI
ncbi:MAG: flippase [Patescibacteria group bacterium]|nr:flippase [Patescibacteria group bacterium]